LFHHAICNAFERLGFVIINGDVLDSFGGSKDRCRILDKRCNMIYSAEVLSRLEIRLCGSTKQKTTSAKMQQVIQHLHCTFGKVYWQCLNLIEDHN